MLLKRRTILASAVFLSALAIPAAGFAEASSLLSPEGIPDRFNGSVDAANILVVYSSPTCSHCVHFEESVLPELQNSVTSGRLRISVRPFVRNALDAVILLLARASGPREPLFSKDVRTRLDEILAADDREALLRQIASRHGLDGAAFDAAIQDQDYFNRLHTLTEQAISAFGVTGTPTLFLNGKAIDYDGTSRSISNALSSAAD